MKAPQAPRLDERRRAQFAAELQERARAWIPEWGLADAEGDFGRALLEIAARFSSEVAERLDGAGEKMRRGFLDWLAVRGQAARPARMPVVFKLADTAVEGVRAAAPVRLQADADGTPVVFETEKDVRVIPGRIDLVVGVDADNDAFYLPPPGLDDLSPLKSVPTEWRLKSFAAGRSKKLQLDPDTGLAAEMLIEVAGKEYRILKVENEIVTIEPPLDADVPEETTVRKVEVFSAFGPATRNRQEHALYVGHMDLLKIDAAATIDVVGAPGLRDGFTWQYWGKVDGSDDIDWQELKSDEKRQSEVSDAVTLKKEKGAIEPRKIDGKNSCWIRAYTRKVDSPQPALRADELTIRINYSEDPPKCEDLNNDSPLAEAMANTTPLVLDNTFFPLGKEPRQFDAFYLGSEEAFSKKGAKVQLCFDMADRTFAAISGVRDGSTPDSVLAGVGKDGSLHLLSFKPDTGLIDGFRERGPLQPPQPGYGGVPQEGDTVTLDPRPRWRSPVWSETDDAPPSTGFLVATSAREAIWIWHEHSITPTKSGWIDFGKLPFEGPATNSTADGLVYLAGGQPVLFALRDGQLFMRQWPAGGTNWTPVKTEHGVEVIKLKSIVPVLVEDSSKRLVTFRDAGMIGIDSENKLFHVAVGGQCTPLLSTDTFDPGILPVAVDAGGARHIAAVTDNANTPELVSVRGAGPSKRVALDKGKEIAGALEAVMADSMFHVLATVRNGGVITWTPFEADSADFIFKSSVSLAYGSPAVVGKYVVVPGARADILVSEFDLTRRDRKEEDVKIGIVVPDSIAELKALEKGDLIVRSKNEEPVIQELEDDGIASDGEVFFEINSPFPDGSTGIDAYDLSEELAGELDDSELTLDENDTVTSDGDWVRIGTEFYKVRSISDSGRIATLKVPNHHGKTPSDGDYVAPIRNARFAPFMKLDASTGDWEAALLNRIPLFFPREKPIYQRAKAFTIDGEGKPKLVVLAQEFEDTPASPAEFWVDAAFGEWRHVGSDTASNPDLSWEYWNGKGWWKLKVIRDDTQNLKTSGGLLFEVPSDIASSDWAGKTNFWIRARLVGGDYGQEEVKVVTRPNPSTQQPEQVVKRSTDKVRAPQVLGLQLSYSIGNGVFPDFVLAQDSGTVRDQSDANRTQGAIVEAFIPLSLMLDRLSRELEARDAGDPKECDCSEPETATEQSGSAVPDIAAADSLKGRSIFLGLDATPSDGPVNILFLVDEKKHSSFAPMNVDAVIANRLVPIVAQDDSRALGETGILSLAFALPPTRGELFGRENLTWLRLRPRPSPDGEWLPTLRGAYLNSVWASSSETLTRELLGSSNGEPHLTVLLARPPVLNNTLELRVREPLGDEEREELVNQDKNIVLSDVENLPGDWVRWKQVVDPDDEPASARVYSLDENTGEIRFGDGIHGKIPPIGRDAIVAFRYSRTEPDPTGGEKVPGNSIAPRTELNLVSPIATVETVTAADQSAGGAPPESDDRVLRFGFSRLRHRERAITAEDIEDLALQSSPDIVQAHAIVRRGVIRLVVVMRGKNPKPNAAQIRELRRLLLASAPVTLSAPGALQIEPPVVRRLRIDLGLQIETLDNAGALTDFVKQALAAFFDQATGGIDKDGWPLGVSPSEADIAHTLVNAPYLESITDMRLREVTHEGRVLPSLEKVRINELVMLAADPVRIQFETSEVMV